MHGVACYHQFLVGRDDRYLDLRIRKGYQRILAGSHIGFIVEFKSEI